MNIRNRIQKLEIKIPPALAEKPKPDFSNLSTDQFLRFRELHSKALDAGKDKINLESFSSDELIELENLSALITYKA